MVNFEFTSRDFRNVKDMDNLFKRISSFKQDNSLQDAVNIPNVKSLFYEPSYLTETLVLRKLGKEIKIAKMFNENISYNHDLINKKAKSLL